MKIFYILLKETRGMVYKSVEYMYNDLHMHVSSSSKIYAVKTYHLINYAQNCVI